MRTPRVADPVEHFWSRVDRRGTDDCWPWQGPPNGSGYGSLQFCGRVLGAHVVAYILAYGDVPEELHVCHTCDTPLCCNARHLFAGTRKDNMRDSARKGRNGSQRHPERRPRGENHWTHTNPEKLARGARVNAGKGKLDAARVEGIRAAYTEDGVSQRQLAQRYGVGQSAISRVIRRARWGWLDG